jgi:hypothetical protein
MAISESAAIWRAIDELRARIGRLELDPYFSKESLGDDFPMAMSKCIELDEAFVKTYGCAVTPLDSEYTRSQGKI